MMQSFTLTKYLLAALLVLLNNTSTAQNDCVVDVPEATAPLLPPIMFPTLPEVGIITLHMPAETRDFGTNQTGSITFSDDKIVYRAQSISLHYDINQDRFFTQETIHGVSPILRMESQILGQFGQFVTSDNAILQRINIFETDFLNSEIWNINLTRANCGLDRIQAPPLVQLHRFSTNSFKSTFSTDLLYIATSYSCIGDTTDNRIYALNADTSEPVWIYNGNLLDLQEVDSITADMIIDKSSDTLYFATERSNPSQDSLWAINVINGTKRWSANVGQVRSKPLLIDNRVYITNLAGEIIALDKNTGLVLWILVAPVTLPLTFIYDADITKTPDNRILIAISDTSGKLYLATDDDITSHWLWIVDIGATHSPIFGLADKNIYVGTSNISGGNPGGEIKQYDIATGTEIASRNVLSSRFTNIKQVTDIKIADTDSIGSTPALYASTSEGSIARFCLPFRTSTPGVDTDNDGIEDGIDNCPDIANATQEDLDQDGLGDVCDPQNYSDTFTYSVGGTVTGLVNGDSIQLQNNNQDDLLVTENGEFTFDTRLLIYNNTSYDVSINVQPSDLTYNCTIEDGSGSPVLNLPEYSHVIEDISIQCSTSGDLIWSNGFE